MIPLIGRPDFGTLLAPCCPQPPNELRFSFSASVRALYDACLLKTLRSRSVFVTGVAPLPFPKPITSYCPIFDPLPPTQSLFHLARDLGLVESKVLPSPVQHPEKPP